MEKHFTHLQSTFRIFFYSDGAIQIDKLIPYAKAQGLKSLAITDHGNIFGAVKFFDACRKGGIKPILGMEAYFTEDVNIRSVEKNIIT